MKCGGLGIPDPRLLAEHAYNTSKEAREVLVGSLPGGTYLNFIAYKGCIHRASADGRKQQELAEKEVLLRQKYLAEVAGGWGSNESPLADNGE